MFKTRMLQMMLAAIFLLGLNLAAACGEKEASEPPGSDPSWETGPVTQEAAMEALNDLDDLGLALPDIDENNVTYLSVTPHDETDGYIVDIEFEPATGIAEADFLAVAGDSTLIAMAKIFANPNVDRVKISAMAERTDAQGNMSTELITSASMNKATGDEINWQELADRQLLDNRIIFCTADEYIIQPVIYDELMDKGCLTAPSRSEG